MNTWRDESAHDVVEKLSDNGIQGFDVFFRWPTIEEAKTFEPPLSKARGECIFTIALYIGRSSVWKAEFVGNIAEFPTVESIIRMLDMDGLFEPYKPEQE